MRRYFLLTSVASDDTVSLRFQYSKALLVKLVNNNVFSLIVGQKTKKKKLQAQLQGPFMTPSFELSVEHSLVVVRLTWDSNPRPLVLHPTNCACKPKTA